MNDLNKLEKETIVIYNPLGKAYRTDIYDTGKASDVFPITDSCERQSTLMGEDFVRLVFNMKKRVYFDAFSYIEYGGKTFFLKERYVPTAGGTTIDKDKAESDYFKYDVKFVSVGNMLSKSICYRHVVIGSDLTGDVSSEWDEPEIQISANLETMYELVLSSIRQAAVRLPNCHYADMLRGMYGNCIDEKGHARENIKLTRDDELADYNFSGSNIADVLTQICQSLTTNEKDTEWWIEEDVDTHALFLHMAKCESDNDITSVSDYDIVNNGDNRLLKPYLSGGLKSCRYEKEWSDIAQIVTPYGSSRNMSALWTTGTDLVTNMMVTYGKRLRLDPNTQYTVYKKSDKDRENPIVITTDSHGAIQNDLVNTGIETSKFYDDVYPQCHFQVTSVSVRQKKSSNVTYLTPEYTITADVCNSKNYNDYGRTFTKQELVALGMMPLKIETGQTLSVRFESGFLNGREFEVANKTTKDEGQSTYSVKLTLIATGSQESGNLIPSGNFIPREGDQFALFNMKMPDEFIALAKQQLAQRAFEDLVELQETRPSVKCKTNEDWFREHGVGVEHGSRFAVESEIFGQHIDVPEDAKPNLLPFSNTFVGNDNIVPTPKKGFNFTQRFGMAEEETLDATRVAEVSEYMEKTEYDYEMGEVEVPYECKVGYVKICNFKSSIQLPMKVWSPRYSAYTWLVEYFTIEVEGKTYLDAKFYDADIFEETGEKVYATLEDGTYPNCIKEYRCDDFYEQRIFLEKLPVVAPDGVGNNYIKFLYNGDYVRAYYMPSRTLYDEENSLKLQKTMASKVTEWGYVDIPHESENDFVEDVEYESQTQLPYYAWKKGNRNEYYNIDYKTIDIRGTIKLIAIFTRNGEVRKNLNGHAVTCIRGYETDELFAKEYIKEEQIVRAIAKHDSNLVYDFDYSTGTAMIKFDGYVIEKLPTEHSVPVSGASLEFNAGLSKKASGHTFSISIYNYGCELRLSFLGTSKIIPLGFSKFVITSGCSVSTPLIAKLESNEDGKLIDAVLYHAKIEEGGFATPWVAKDNAEYSVRFLSRVTQFSYKLTKPWDIDFTLASSTVQGTLSAMQSAIADATSGIGSLNQRAVNLSRRGWHDAAEMADMLDSMQTEMMLVGNEQNQFAFTFSIDIIQSGETRGGVVYPHGGVVFGYGQLQHTQEPYVKNNFGGLWYNPSLTIVDMAADGENLRADELDENKSYYVFAICGSDTQQLSLALVESEKAGAWRDEKPEDNPNPAHFLLGTLSSEFEGERVFNRTNGFTSVAGGTITTEQIQDAGRNLIIDFQSNPPRIIARNGAQIIGNMTFYDTEGTANNVGSWITQFKDAIKGTKTDLLPTSQFGELTDDKYVFSKGTSAFETRVANPLSKFNSGYIVHVDGVISKIGRSGFTQIDFVAVYDNDETEVMYSESVTGTYISNDKTFSFDFVIEKGKNLKRVQIVDSTVPIQHMPHASCTISIVTSMKSSLVKDNAWKYITDAMENGSSEIAGGLFLTQVLMLKDSDNISVKAGMSGRSDDGVLLWGDADYPQAVYAAEHDYYKDENQNEKITTLLKKDGTGKIGVFLIGKDKVVVDTPNGDVVIDGEKGIFVKDDDNIDKIALITDTLENKDRYINRYKYYDFVKDTIKTYSNVGGFEKNTLFDLTSVKGDSNTIHANGELNVELSCDVFYWMPSEVYRIVCNVEYETELGKVGNVFFKSWLAHYNEVEDDIYNQRPHTFLFNMQIDNTITIPTSYGKLKRLYIQFTSENTSETGVDHWQIGGATVVDKSVYTINVMSLLTNSAYTLIAKNGIESYYDSSHCFRVENGDSKQKIIAKGLSTTKGASGSGEMYVSNQNDANGLVGTLIESYEKIAVALEMARYEGENDSYQKAVRKAINSAKTAMSKISIVATS